MKNILLKLLLVIMAMALALFVVSCSSGDESQEPTSESVSESVIEQEPTSESVSESVIESVSVPEEIPIVGAGENGEVNLGNALDILAPVLDNDYITVSFTLDSVTTTNQTKVESQTQVNAYAKRTLSGYDVVATFVQTAKAQNQSYPIATITIYYVDGLAVYGVTDYESEEPTVAWVKSDVGTFNELINALNQMIASDEEALATYGEIMKAVEKLEIILSEEDLTNIDNSMSFDLSTLLNKVLEFVVNHKDEDLYSFALEYAWGVDVEDADAVSTFEASFAEWCGENPTLFEAINMIVDSINERIIETARQESGNDPSFDETQVFQIDLETLLDLLQEQLGMSTAQVIELIVSEVPELADYLTAPEGDESLYDYLSVRAQMITVDDLAKAITGKSDTTLLNELSGLKTTLSNVTMGAFINGVLNNYLNGNDNDVDYILMVEELNFSLQAFVVGYTFKTDAYGRPTEIGENFRVQASLINPDTELATDIITVENEEIVNIILSYARPYVSFEIPQEILDVAVDAETLA